jgi:iron complex outermembrane receptor protein
VRTAKNRFAAIAVAASLGLTAAHAQVVAVASPRQLADLSLEELSNLEVTSVSGRSESLQHAATSIFVIPAQEIRRSAATNLPEALRLAPNLQVAQTSAGQFAISARGFQDLIANKLLVLVDGRTIYSPLFAGVFWDANDVVLEDIDRIEVISGPGGTLWGANAVNGVINVVTRNAAQTQGTLLSVTRSHEGGRAVVRWGAPAGDHGHLRLYALAVDRGSTRLPGTGVALQDSSTRNQRASEATGPGAHPLSPSRATPTRAATSRPTPWRRGSRAATCWHAGEAPWPTAHRIWCRATTTLLIATTSTSSGTVSRRATCSSATNPRWGSASCCGVLDIGKQTTPTFPTRRSSSFPTTGR